MEAELTEIEDDLSADFNDERKQIWFEHRLQLAVIYRTILTLSVSYHKNQRWP